MYFNVLLQFTYVGGRLSRNLKQKWKSVRKAIGHLLGVFILFLFHLLLVLIIDIFCYIEFVQLTQQHHNILLKQLAKHATDWRVIARNLGFSLAEMGNIEGRPLLQAKAPTSWLSTMLEEWLHWKPGDARRSHSFATLGDLKAALKKAKLTDTARTLSASIKMENE